MSHLKKFEPPEITCSNCGCKECSMKFVGKDKRQRDIWICENIHPITHCCLECGCEEVLRS